MPKKRINLFVQGKVAGWCEARLMATRFRNGGHTFTGLTWDLFIDRCDMMVEGYERGELPVVYRLKGVK